MVVTPAACVGESTTPMGLIHVSFITSKDKPFKVYKRWFAVVSSRLEQDREAFGRRQAFHSQDTHCRQFGLVEYL